MNRNFAVLLALALASVCLTGCVTSGMFPAAHLTQVELSEENFSIVAVDVEGEAEAGYILGVSGGPGLTMSTLALYRVSGTGMLYQEALDDLWRNVEIEYGDPEGSSMALVNVRYDTEALNLLIYTRPKVVVRADVIEFID